MNDNNNQSGFYLLSDNTDAFVARFALATMATKTLDIQYYIMHNDASGQYLAYAILSAADRGVQVRILVDDINLAGRDSSLKMLSQHENIKIRVFNPLVNRDWLRNIELMINLNRAGRRMHNKVFISDNSVAIVGGRNIGDEYFDNRKNINFVDLDLLTVGSIITDISKSFNEFWECMWSTPIEKLSSATVIRRQLNGIRNRLKDKWSHAKNSEYFKTLQQSDLTKKIINKNIPFIWASATLFYDHPGKVKQDTTQVTVHFGPQVTDYFKKACKQILITSPYFVPRDQSIRELSHKVKQGVEIKILTNSLSTTDVIAVHAGYKKYRNDIIKAGIKLFELKSTAKNIQAKTKILLKGSSRSSLHAKYMVIDQRYVFIGSANFDPRSNTLNTEIGIMIESEALAAETNALFCTTSAAENSYELLLDNKNDKNNILWKTIELDKEAYYANEPSSSWGRKLAAFLMSFLPIEHLL